MIPIVMIGGPLWVVFEPAAMGNYRPEAVIGCDY
jgi:hypothetical protein